MQSDTFTHMKTLNDIHGQEIETLYLSGQTTTQIADKFGVSFPSILAVLTKRGIPRRAKGLPVGSRKPDSDLFVGERLERLKELLTAGGVMTEIASDFGVSLPTIIRYAKRHGLHTPRKTLTEEKRQDIISEVRSGVPAIDVAAKYEIAPQLVWSITRRSGIDLKTIDNERRRSAATPSELKGKLRYARERQRIENDPEFAAKMTRKQEQHAINRHVKYAESMRKFQENGCRVCGIKNPYVLDAHHRDPATKKFDVSSRERINVSVEELESELAKCDCLCAYHHRILHATVAPSRKTEDLSKTGRQVVAARERIDPIMADFYSKGCSQCGNPGPVGLSAHHRDPSTKAFNISEAIPLRTHSATLIAELAKCDCLCENCHRVLHRGETLAPAEYTPTDATTPQGLKLTEVIPDILELYQGGMSITDLAEGYQVDRGTMRSTLLYAGAELRDNWSRSAGRLPTKDDIAAFIKRYEAGETATTIGDSMEFSPSTVYKYIKQSGVEPRRTGPAPTSQDSPAPQPCSPVSQDYSIASENP